MTSIARPAHAEFLGYRSIARRFLAGALPAISLALVILGDRLA